MYQLFVIFYYSGVYFVKIFKPLTLILVQYLNEKFDSHEMFWLKASIISTTISQYLLGVQNNKTNYGSSF